MTTQALEEAILTELSGGDRHGTWAWQELPEVGQVFTIRLDDEEVGVAVVENERTYTFEDDSYLDGYPDHVYKLVVKVNDKFYKKDLTYRSFDGSEYGEFREVTPQTKTVTVWE